MSAAGAEDKDHSRPFFQRMPGHVGIYVDIYDAAAEDPKQFGSERFFFNDLRDRLYQEVKNFPLDVFKGWFERRNLLQGAIFAGFSKALVMAVDIEKLESLDSLWTCHQRQVLGPAIQEILITPQILKNTHTKKISLVVKLWDDEFQACKAEIQSKKLKPCRLEERVEDQLMLKKIQQYQQHVPNAMMKMRDEFSKFENYLADMTGIVKGNIPLKVQRISTFKEFEAVIRPIRARKDQDMSSIDNYIQLRRDLSKMLDDLERHICHPLMQVHADCETAQQRALKSKMRKMCKDMHNKLESEYDFSKLKHSEWQVKIINRDHNLFLGLISVVALALDTIMDMDQATDEYISGIEIKL